MSALRVPFGVMALGHTSDERGTIDMDLATGDTIHGVKGTPVTSVIEVRRALDALKPRSRSNAQRPFIVLAFELD